MRRGITIALAVGFFVALVLAWYHGEKGAQRMTGTELSIIALLLALGGAALWYLAPANHSSSAGVPTQASLGEMSTAVLPFVNMSGDKGNEYFSDGMTETLLDRLAQVPQLKVAARTSSFSFKGTNTDVRKIGAALGVASLVEGSVQQAGDTLRITAQLVRAVDGSHLWSMHYDRKAADLFAIQDEIAGSVTAALVGELAADEDTCQGRTRICGLRRLYPRLLQQINFNTSIHIDRPTRCCNKRWRAIRTIDDAALINAWYSMRRPARSSADYRERAVPMLGRVERSIRATAGARVSREIAQERGEHPQAVQLGQRGVAAAPGDARTHHLADIYYFSATVSSPRRWIRSRR